MNKLNIAYMITGYKDPKLIKRLILSLDIDNELMTSYIYIHIDKKVCIDDFLCYSDNSRINFMKDRKKIYWGGFSQVESLIGMMDEIESNNIDNKVTRIVCISGSDYPIKSNYDIYNYFINNEKEYIISYNVSESKLKKQRKKINQYYFYEMKIKNKSLFLFFRRFSYVVFGIISKIKKRNSLIRSEFLGDIDVYFGSDYFSVTFEAMCYLNNIIKNDFELRNYLRHSFAPSELFVHTILQNSEFKDKTLGVTYKSSLKDVTPLTLIEPLPDFGKGWKIFTEEDYNTIIISDKLFFRKVDSEISDSLLDLIDKNRLSKENWK